MTLMPDELKDSMVEIARKLQSGNYRRILNHDLKPLLKEDERASIITACAQICSVLKGNDEFIEDYHNKAKRSKKLKKRHKDDLLSRKDALSDTGMKPSTFDRRAKKEGIIEVVNGKRRYRVENLEKLMQLIINSSKSALCIEIYFLFDRNRAGYIPFRAGEYYPIVEESRNFVDLYNKKYRVTLRLPREILLLYFRVEE